MILSDPWRRCQGHEVTIDAFDVLGLCAAADAQSVCDCYVSCFYSTGSGRFESPSRRVNCYWVKSGFGSIYMTSLQLGAVWTVLNCAEWKYYYLLTYLLTNLFKVYCQANLCILPATLVIREWRRYENADVHSKQCLTTKRSEADDTDSNDSQPDSQNVPKFVLIIPTGSKTISELSRFWIRKLCKLTWYSHIYPENPSWSSARWNNECSLQPEALNCHRSCGIAGEGWALPNSQLL